MILLIDQNLKWTEDFIYNVNIEEEGSVAARHSNDKVSKSIDTFDYF